MKGSAFLLFLCCLLPAAGQSPKTPVVFDCDCTDSVGSQYATAVRDLLAASPRYTLAFTAEEKGKDGKPTTFRWHIKGLSLDPSSNNNGQDSVISVVLLVGDGIYMTQQVQWCPQSKIQSCAAGTVSFMDGYVNSK